MQVKITYDYLGQEEVKTMRYGFPYSEYYSKWYKGSEIIEVETTKDLMKRITQLQMISNKKYRNINFVILKDNGTKKI